MEMVTWILNNSLGNDSCLFDFHGNWDSFICLRVNGAGTSKYQLSLVLNTWLLFLLFFLLCPAKTNDPSPLLLHPLGKPCPIPVSRYSSVPTPCSCAFPLKSESEVIQLCPTLCNSVDCSPQGSSGHGILQARILEWVAISFSRGSSQPRDQTRVSCIAGRHFTFWSTREAWAFPLGRVIALDDRVGRFLWVCQPN